MGKTVDIITILGHTAGGKTKLAANVGFTLNGEVISADSRQVYRGMDIGTGKDYSDYVVKGTQVTTHLIDIVDAGYEYNVYEFQKDFFNAAEKIMKKSKLPVLCGGTGLYIESLLRGYGMPSVSVNRALRDELEGKSMQELEKLLRSYKTLHNQSDTDTRKRAIRAIEIAEYISKNGQNIQPFPEVNSITFGVRYTRDERRRRITERLTQRLEEGMVEEAEQLISSGLSFEKLEYYGLEYKFLAQYLSGRLSYDAMFSGLNTAIHRFAKRQMTYFRGMERRGIPIHWIEGSLPLEEKIKAIIDLWNNHQG
ncbi:MAG TPA: tRNA (adenosine(37)-N6)-dimethylallyltransferase MiaA [Bacteroidales bacterium]|nr:tRNA (adenosine(37)-N6)-dimethylallyltransferase MiaA [Bacteroidales bacterium]